MTTEVVVTSVLIVLARVADVSLGTLRMAAVIQGRRGAAFLLGFVEILIWVVAVSQVVANLQHPMYAVSYAAGFALGNFLGVTIEQHIAVGEQVLRIFSHRADMLAAALRERGFWVTKFDGEGRDGPVGLLFIALPRRDAPKLAALARELDPECFYVLDDVRLAVSAYTGLSEPSGWRSIRKRK
jgi:uncharacterized protein YebE (UPF0316 family)